MKELKQIRTGHIYEACVKGMMRPNIKHIVSINVKNEVSTDYTIYITLINGDILKFEFYFTDDILPIIRAINKELQRIERRN